MIKMARTLSDVTERAPLQLAHKSLSFNTLSTSLGVVDESPEDSMEVLRARKPLQEL